MSYCCHDLSVLLESVLGASWREVLFAEKYVTVEMQEFDDEILLIGLSKPYGDQVNREHEEGTIGVQVLCCVAFKLSIFQLSTRRCLQAYHTRRRCSSSKLLFLSLPGLFSFLSTIYAIIVAPSS